MLLPRREARLDESSAEISAEAQLLSSIVIAGQMTGSPKASDAESQQLLWTRYGSLKNTGSC